jgi:hypothetical protein
MMRSPSVLSTSSTVSLSPPPSASKKRRSAKRDDPEECEDDQELKWRRFSDIQQQTIALSFNLQQLREITLKDGKSVSEEFITQNKFIEALAAEHRKFEVTLMPLAGWHQELANTNRENQELRKRLEVCEQSIRELQLNRVLEEFEQPGSVSIQLPADDSYLRCMSPPLSPLPASRSVSPLPIINLMPEVRRAGFVVL